MDSSGCRMGSSDIMEDAGNGSSGGNRGSHNNKGRSKGAASDRLEKCSEGRMS